jgi:hypothetical protein
MSVERMAGGGITLNITELDWVEAATDVAVTVTLRLVETDAGAT